MILARWNLFRGGGDKAEELAAAERKTAAQDLVDDTKRAVSENVAIAYQARATSESRIIYASALYMSPAPARSGSLPWRLIK